MQWRRFYDLKGAHDAETTFEPDDEGTSVFHASADDEGGVSSLVSFPTHVSGEVPAACKVLRFSNGDIHERFYGVCVLIDRAVKERIKEMEE